MPFVLSGRIVPLSNQAAVASSETVAFRGKVWIGDDGRIKAVTRGTKKGPAGFETATRLDVGTHLVVPGLIDLHSHLAYATLPLWAEDGRTEPYLHHDIWPGRPTYAAEVTWPAYAFIEAAPAELLAYAETRALVGGTTSIQGSPPSNKPLDGWLVRNVEDERFGGAVGTHQVLASTLTLKPAQLGDRANKMRAGACFIYHCAEGRPGSLVAREYDAVRSAGCLQRKLVAIHTNAVDGGAYASWGAEPGAVVWSPFSNLWLYGTTTDVPAVRDRGLTVCVGADWAPSGTRNVLGELKVASLVNDDKGWGLSAFDLVKMVTANPGDVLQQAWGIQTGRLQPDALADIAVIKAGANAKVFDTILKATERDIQLVLVHGRPAYGTAALMQAAGAAAATPIDVDGTPRQIALTRFTEAGAPPWNFADVLARLEQVRANPKREIERARLGAFAALSRGKPAPLRLALDMPTGRAPIGGLPKDLGSIVVPPIAPLAHDAAFFASITGRGFHGALLDGLARFYA